MQKVNHGHRARQQRRQQQRQKQVRKMLPAIAAASAAIVSIQSTDALNGSWSFLASGLWSTASNWVNSNIADGASASADFSKLNITADTTVSLDSPRTIGQLLFADTTQSNQWTLDNGGNAAN